MLLGTCHMCVAKRRNVSQRTVDRETGHALNVNADIAALQVRHSSVTTTCFPRRKGCSVAERACATTKAQRFTAHVRCNKGVAVSPARLARALNSACALQQRRGSVTSSTGKGIEQRMCALLTG